ncbi:MAG: PGF-pre-PGF domain-containing protein [Candidatus Aenigmarchaeota archaeon]|nr:PGF-pre-PGF domain-containing protein [Candidatus Aenigmarchaeota archaeon]
MDKYSLLAALIVFFASAHAAHALAQIIPADNGPPVAVLVGNLSQTYQLQANLTINSTEGQRLNFNVTIIMPYGLENTTACDAQSFTTTNFICVVVTNTPINGSGIFQANVTVRANISAFPSYGSDTVNFSIVGENATANSTVKTITGGNFWRNPRPHLTAGQVGNVRFRFKNWNQTDSTYKVMVPIWTYNASANRPQLAGASYGEVMYFDKSFFEEPSYMRTWSYNLSFRIYFDRAENQTFNMISVINSSNNSAQSAEGLLPLESLTFETRSFNSNATRNFTIGVPNSYKFTVYFNGTEMNNSVLARDYGINMTYSGGDPTVRLFDINVSTNNLSLVNGTEIGVLLTVVNVTGCQSGPAETGRCSMSPIYVQTQQSSGLNFDQPPAFGTSLNISFLVNVTNRFSNYTVQDLRLSFMQPMNVTMNRNGTANQFNMTLPNQVKMLVWNTSALWEENLSVTRTDSTMQFNDTHGPAQGAIVNVSISTYDVRISANTATFRNWDPGTAGSGYAYVNFTAEMAFPTLDEATSTPGTVGSNNSYNATINSPVRSNLNLTNKVPGFNSSATGIIITVDGVQLTSGNYTVGSLVINDVTSGQHTIAVSYNVPAASSSSSSSTSTSSGGGGGGTAPETDKKIHRWSNLIPGTEYFMNVSSSKISVSEIHYEVLQKIESVQIAVQSLPSMPAEITIEPSGKVFQYVNITATDIDQSDIRNTRIRFMVSRAWLDENNFAPDDVLLQRFANGAWQKLETTPLGRTDGNYEFEAVTPGFSIFAVTAELAPEEEPAPQEEPPEEEVPPAPELPPPPQQTPEEAPFDASSALIVIGVLIIIAILGYIHYHHAPQKRT